MRLRDKQHLERKDRFEKNEGPSLTEPDGALSIREILVNFTRGTLPPIQKTPQYASDEQVDHEFENDSQLDDITNDPSYFDDLKNYSSDLLSSEASRDQDEPQEEEEEDSKDDLENPSPTPE